MRVLITGCLGHIGSYLVENIHKIKKIKKIYLLDNISNNKFFTLSNIKNTNQKKIFIYEDLINPRHLYKIKNIAGITEITCGNLVIIKPTITRRITKKINFNFFLKFS